MKVGDYVRTKKGTIYQFNSTSSKALSGAKKYMVKSSPNIIDLIEVGDYVNGYLVTTGNQNVGSVYISEIDGLGLKKKLYEKDIKSIVTHEQFEAMKYEIK